MPYTPLKPKHMNKNSNTYTFIYAALLVVVVAAVLAYVSESLKPIQQANIDTEKRVSILASAHLGADIAQAEDKNTYTATLFEKYITRSYLVNSKGEVLEGDAFSAEMSEQYNLIRQLPGLSTQEQEKLRANLRLPVFECSLDDGTLLYIVQTYGQGLWGPLWGYVSIKDDFNTIYGAVFAHKGETPGLGSEIATPAYASQFEGKAIFDNGKFVSIAVVKGGARPGDPHSVDAVSGGTITSNGLQDMIHVSLQEYVPFFTQKLP